MRKFTLFVLSVWASVSLATATACSKSSASTPRVTPPVDLSIAVTSTDDIWALAPANTNIGVVVAKGTGTHLLSALTEMERSMAGHAVGATIHRA